LAFAAFGPRKIEQRRGCGEVGAWLSEESTDLSKPSTRKARQNRRKGAKPRPGIRPRRQAAESAGGGRFATAACVFVADSATLLAAPSSAAACCADASTQQAGGDAGGGSCAGSGGLRQGFAAVNLPL